MNKEPYVIEESGLSIASGLTRSYNISRTGYIKSLWVRLENVAPAGGISVVVQIKNHLGNLKPVKDITIPAGERDFVFFYDNNKGYPLVEHNITGGVTKDKIIVTIATHAGNTADVEIICG